jgi:hypothetical protein
MIIEFLLLSDTINSGSKLKYKYIKFNIFFDIP